MTSVTMIMAVTSQNSFYFYCSPYKFVLDQVFFSLWQGIKVFDVVFYSFVIIIAVGICATLTSLLVVSTAKQRRG